jgi:stage V sporulation protein R
MDHARDTLTALVRVWRRPVNLVTVFEGKQRMLRFDGKDHTERSVG